ncbi:MAG: 3-oxoacid CoA-transferase [Dehalococcoidia bacterium]|nr:3-oxoacid CoA-transferase [Dehalococcoidia bacterium]
MREFLAFTTAGTMEDGKAAFVGTGLPMIAAMLAQKTHAPNLLMIFEAGSIGPQLPELPISVGQGLTTHHALAASSMHDVMSAQQSGFIDYGFLGGAQIDIYGNINTTCIGDHDLPKVRLPGSGGANDIASACHRTVLVFGNQTKRTFVEKLDFMTSPGYLTGPGAREAAGLPANTGPYRVVSQLAMYDFDDKTKKMRLFSLHPGVTVEEVKDNCSFDLIIPEKYGISSEPSDRDLEILRTQIDPTGMLIGK